MDLFEALTTNNKNYFFENHDKIDVKIIYNNRHKWNINHHYFLYYMSKYYLESNEKYAKKLNLHYFQLALKQNNVFAQHDTAQKYLEDRDYDNADEYLKLSADQGYFYSQIIFLHLQYIILPHNKKNYSDILKYAILAKDNQYRPNGFERIYYFLGNGYEVNKDYENAIYYYHKYCESGLLEYLYDCIYYMIGIYLDYLDDYEKALELYEKYKDHTLVQNRIKRIDLLMMKSDAKIKYIFLKEIQPILKEKDDIILKLQMEKNIDKLEEEFNKLN